MRKNFKNRCPFCGEEGTEKYEYYVSVKHKKDCLFYEEEDYGLTAYDIPKWQSRPLEDTLRNDADNWRNTATVLSVRLKTAVEALKGISMLWHGRGLAPKVLEELDKTISEIEGE